MANETKNSQVADRGSSIINSKNQTTYSINRIRAESALISFVVGTASAIMASYIYEHFLK